jgi:hypothetical protein
VLKHLGDQEVGKKYAFHRREPSSVVSPS